MAENVWRNNDLTFISIVAEPVSRDYELHSLVSPWDNWCISRCCTDRRSLPSGLFLSAKRDYPKLVQHSGLVSFTIELQARFTYEWHVTPLRPTWRPVFFRIEHYVISFSRRIRDDVVFSMMNLLNPHLIMLLLLSYELNLSIYSNNQNKID